MLFVERNSTRLRVYLGVCDIVRSFGYILYRHIYLLAYYWISAAVICFSHTAQMLCLIARFTYKYGKIHLHSSDLVIYLARYAHNLVLTLGVDLNSSQLWRRQWRFSIVYLKYTVWVKYCIISLGKTIHKVIKYPRMINT